MSAEVPRCKPAETAEEHEFDDLRRRVKIYHMQQKDGANQWVPSGVGLPRLRFVKELGLLCLEVVDSQDKDKLLLQSEVVRQDIYRKESNTMMLWPEQSTGKDVVLAFLEEEVRDQMMKQLDHARASLMGPGGILADEEDDDGMLGDASSNDFDDDDDFGYRSMTGLTADHLAGSSPIHEYTGAPVITLPPVNMLNIKEIFDMVMSAGPLARGPLGTALLEDGYIDGLLEFVCQFEEPEQQESGYELFLRILNLNHSPLMEFLLMFENLPSLVTVLSHDPNVPKRRRVDHSKFLRSAKFEEVIPLDDPHFVEEIHHTYMLQYLKDSILIGALDDMALSSISAAVFHANASIVGQLAMRDDFHRRLYSAMEKETQPEKHKKLSGLLLQFIDLTKEFMDPLERQALFDKLGSLGLFESFQWALSVPDEKVQLNIVSCLNTTVLIAPNLLREFLVSKAQREEDYPLMSAIIDSFESASNSSEMGQFGELLRHIVDKETMEERLNEGLTRAEEAARKGKRKESAFVWKAKTEFMSVFFSTFMPMIFRGIIKSGEESISHLTPTLRAEQCDLLTYMLPMHGARVQYFILTHRIMENVAALLKKSPGTLTLAIIRFLRAVVYQRDRGLNQRLMQRHLFDTFFEVFRTNMQRYNMINSAVLELLAFLQTDEYNQFSFIAYLVNRYRKDLEQATYAPMLKALIEKHENHEIFMANGGQLPPSPDSGRKRTHGEAFEDDDYFNTLSDDEEMTPPLQDLQDIDDDEKADKLGLPSVRRPRDMDDEEEEDDFCFGGGLIKKKKKSPTKSNGMKFSPSIAKRASDADVAAAAAEAARSSSPSKEDKAGMPSPTKKAKYA